MARQIGENGLKIKRSVCLMLAASCEIKFMLSDKIQLFMMMSQ